MTEICIVVVTYNPNIDEFFNGFLCGLNSAIPICIVDNSTDVSKQEFLLGISSEVIHLIQMKENVGIAKAQNLGMEWAFSHGYRAIILMDQDSVISVQSVKKYVELYTTLVEHGNKVACIGATPLDRDRDIGLNSHYEERQDKTDRYHLIEKTQSSGSLIHKDAYLEVGNMEERLFIDLVDWEWCWRAKEFGYKCYVMEDVLLGHRFGEDTWKILFNLSIGIPRPVRHYYQVRNYIVLCKRGYIPVNFKIRYLMINFFKIIFFSTFVPPRKIRFKNFMKGITDGVLEIYRIIY